MRSATILAAALSALASAAAAETAACRQQIARFDDFGVRRMSAPVPNVRTLGPGFAQVWCVPNEDSSSCRYRDARGVTYDVTYWAVQGARLDRKTADIKEGAALPWGLRRDDTPVRVEARLRSAGLEARRSRGPKGLPAVEGRFEACDRAWLAVEFDKSGVARAWIMTQ